MRRKILLLAMAVPFLYAFSATDVGASKEVIVEPVSGPPITINAVSGAPSFSCQLGNLDPPTYAVGGFILPPEEYNLVFDPLQSCSNCSVGFVVTAVHVVLQTSDSCTVLMAVDVEEAQYPHSADCAEPGIEWCASSQYSIDLPSAGVWDVKIPIECMCLASNRIYLLSFHVLNASCGGGGVPDLITDGEASLCTNWNNYGAGWYDLVPSYPTWPGDLLFFAEAVCCSPPVPAGEGTWGSIKRLYER